MSDQAASALGNIPAGDQLWYWLACLAICCLLGCAMAGVIRAACWLRDTRARRRVQRGLGCLAAIAEQQQHGYASAPTEAISMRGMVISARGLSAIAADCPCCTARDYRDGDCSCPVPCGWEGCQAIDPDPALGCPWCTVPYAWPCTCASQCGDPACVAAVRL